MCVIRIKSEFFILFNSEIDNFEYPNDLFDINLQLRLVQQELSDKLNFNKDFEYCRLCECSRDLYNCKTVKYNFFASSYLFKLKQDEDDWWYAQIYKKDLYQTSYIKYTPSVIL